MWFTIVNEFIEVLITITCISCSTYTSNSASIEWGVREIFWS